MKTLFVNTKNFGAIKFSGNVSTFIYKLGNFLIFYKVLKKLFRYLLKTDNEHGMYQKILIDSKNLKFKIPDFWRYQEVKEYFEIDKLGFDDNEMVNKLLTDFIAQDISTIHCEIDGINANNKQDLGKRKRDIYEGESVTYDSIYTNNTSIKFKK